MRSNLGGDSHNSMNYHLSKEENMSKKKFASLLILIFGASIVAYAQSRSGADATGIWSGSWTGGNTGKFEMTIEKDADGKLSATFFGTPDQGESYTIHSTYIEFNGSKLTMKFEGSDSEAEAMIQAIIEGSSMKGDYSIRSKAGGELIDKGTFTAAMK